jgi:DNA-binding CsgD family transcriptional regulator
VSLRGDDEQRVSELTRQLRTWRSAEPPILPTILSDLRELLGAEEAVAIGVSQAPRGLGVSLFEATGIDAPKTRAVREWLSRGAMPRAAPSEPDERSAHNRALGSFTSTQCRLCDMDSLTVLLGLDRHDQLRALVCDTPSLQAWLSAFRPGNFTGREREILARLTPPLRERLALEWQVAESALNTAALGATLEAIPAPAFILSGGGSVKHANAAGAALLEIESEAGNWLCEAAKVGGNGRFSMMRLIAEGATDHYLAILRRPPNDLLPRLAVASALWNLTRKQSEVVSWIVRGARNKTIARQIGSMEGTVELHITAILAKAQVENRLELIAKFWTEL